MKATSVASPAPAIAAPASLAELLFPALHRRRVLALLMLHPERQLHVRELARLTGAAAGTLNKELARLHEAGLLLREASGNQLRYSANTGSAVYAELAALLRKTAGVADVLREALAPLASITGKVTMAFVYGSVAAGTEGPSSDVDVMILGSASFADVARAFAKASSLLGREVNPTPMATKAFVLKLAQGDGFARAVAKGQKIWLIGNEHDFAKLAAHRPR